jgi:hypothetical protein
MMKEDLPQEEFSDPQKGARDELALTLDETHMTSMQERARDNLMNH